MKSLDNLGQCERVGVFAIPSLVFHIAFILAALQDSGYRSADVVVANEQQQINKLVVNIIEESPVEEPKQPDNNQRSNKGAQGSKAIEPLELDRHEKGQFRQPGVQDRKGTGPKVDIKSLKGRGMGPKGKGAGIGGQGFGCIGSLGAKKCGTPLGSGQNR